MEDILLPSKIEVSESGNPNEWVVIVEPLFHGYGATLGNALRRTMLSSLPGSAVVAVKIKGGQHEFSTLEHVKEDVLEIILNLKQVRLKCFSEEPVKVRLHAKGKKNATAADIEASSDVEIANPKQHIATLTDDKAELDMELTVARGRGYVPTEERSKEPELGTIAVDALYSPVRNVGYKVEDVRVGQITNFDKLTLTIETDGTIEAQEAVNKAAQLLVNHLNVIAGVGTDAVTGLSENSSAEGAVVADEVVSEESDDESGKKKKKAKK